MRFVLPLPQRQLPAPALALAAWLPAPSVSVQEEGWRWTLTPYAWATDVGVDLYIDGTTVVSETIPVEDLMEDLDLTFQGRIEGRRGAYGALLDVFYVSMSDEVNGLTLPQGAGQGDLDWQLDMLIADVAGTYSLEQRGWGPRVTWIGGARIVAQDAELDASFTTPGGTVQDAREASDTLVDVLAGLSLSADLTERLGFETQLDVSFGETDHTWSAHPALSYSLWDGRCRLLAGYRHMAIEFEEEDGLSSEVSMSGPVLGLKIEL